MTFLARSTRSRVTTLAVGLALSLSLLAAPAVVAEDHGPESVVQGLLADIEAANFEAIGGWFCAEFAEQASRLDMSALAADLPPDVDTSTMLDAFDFDVTIESIETVSETDNEAIVSVVAQLAMNIDVPALEPLIVALLQAGGQEVTPDMVEMVGGLMASQIGAESIDISEEITVVRNADGTWGQIGSELGGDDDDTEADGAVESEAAATEGEAGDGE